MSHEREMAFCSIRRRCDMVVGIPRACLFCVVAEAQRGFSGCFDRDSSDGLHYLVLRTSLSGENDEIAVLCSRGLPFSRCTPVKAFAECLILLGEGDEAQFS